MDGYNDKVLTVISEVSPLGGDITMEDELATIGIDSLKKVNLIVLLEDNLGIHFNDSDLDPSKLIKVSDVVRLVGMYVV